ncbi:membrane protein insertion efficiency factor YidD [Terrihabitans sp. B22-R8]|uniref:membrane protein insertion efficiency factor YidD n=1 Tax=Terrihabitans sp. B22-R8 TaxID=3425128 RepID=UPI00403C3DBA
MKRVLLAPIWLYRMAISPMLGPRCRYQPTCSAYAVEAIERHGGWAGGWMLTARLCRCHPLGPAGFDPVPQELPTRTRWYMPWRYGRWTGRHMTTRLDTRVQCDRIS